MTSKFRKCSVSSTPPPYGDESSSDDDPCRVIRGAFLPWWCRNPAISKVAGASNCFPSMRFSDGYSVQNQKYVRASAASPPRQRGRGARADGEVAGGRGGGRSVSCSDCPSCCHIRPPRPIAARGAREERPERACASASSAGSTPSPSPAPSEVNVARVGRPCARARARRREAAAPAACCALCERAGAGARGPRRRCVAGAPARVRRDKQLVSAQRLRFDSAAEVARLQAAVREEYATRVAVHYLLRLGELQLRRRPADDARGGGALRGYMKMRV